MKRLNKRGIKLIKKAIMLIGSDDELERAMDRDLAMSIKWGDRVELESVTTRKLTIDLEYGNYDEYEQYSATFLVEDRVSSITGVPYLVVYPIAFWDVNDRSFRHCTVIVDGKLLTFLPEAQRDIVYFASMLLSDLDSKGCLEPY